MAVEEPCPFCFPAVEARVILRNGFGYTIWTEETPLGSAMVLPVAHRPTVFDLTEAEWKSMRELLHRMRNLVTGLHHPDGWNVGWNVGEVGGQSVAHAHCHLIPRYRAEPLAGQGLRHELKRPSNRPPHHTELPVPSWRSAADSAGRELRP